MRTSLRAKLASITAIAAVALVVVAASSLAASARVTDRLVAIRSDFLPKIALRPRLEHEFDQLRRAFQDAVAAQDAESIDDARRRREEIGRLLTEAGPALDTTRVARLRRELDDYVSVATNLSYRLIAGETGEDLVEAMGAMQTRQGRVAALIDEATAFRQDDLERSFASALATQRDAARVLIVASAACLVLTMFLSWWLGRGMVRSVGALIGGFQRIGRGDFDRPIEPRTHDEFADLASSANAMAKDLAQIAAERERAKWLKEGAVGLADEIRGELSRSEVSKRALRYLVRYANAQLGAVYGVDDGAITLLASHALTGDSEGPSQSFRLGEGIVGQAALDAEPTFLDEVPPGALRVRSGFLDGTPPALAFVPLAIDGRAVGVLELAAVRAFPARTKNFLESISETVAIALEVARSRGATRELLVATQTLAQRLAAQEEELRSANEELEVQQEALRERNDELVQQASELESQRRTVEAKNTELESARSTLQQKADELATMSAYKSQFLANMSHELRTPLNSMLLLSSLLAENSAGNLTPKQAEHSRTIHSAGTDLLALINQVLDLSKIEAGKTDIHLEPVGLASITTQLRRMFEHLAQDKGLAFEVVVDPSLPADVTTDRHRILQILTNLVGNAIKFTARGEVRVEVLRAAATTVFRRQDLDAASTVAFIVSDTGPGIPSEHCDRIFEPFEQVGGAKERRSGTGLGLAIARELAALLGGEIGVSSEVGKGSRFVLHIPIGTGTTAEATPSGVAQPSLAPMTTALRMLPSENAPPTILLIEDDPTFASVFSDLVVAQGLRCIVAGDGATGVRLARDARPAGIVLDLGLPDIDGYAVLERLRADSLTASIPVHIVSGADGAERAKKLGVVGYLKKPATKDDLVRSIEALVPGRPDRPLRVLVVEDDVTIGESLVAMLAVDRIEARRVGTAVAALEALASGEFRCAIVDLSLPDMDGLDLLRTLEARDGANRPPVIVYTGRALSKAETQTIERYAEAVVLKEGASIARVLDEVKLFTRTLRKRVANDSVQRPLPAVEAKLAGRKLLLVDDDMRTVYALSAMLRSRGAEVVVADTGRAALSSLDEHPDVDAVLMDIMMPEMDGYEAMRRIRELPRFRALPIIALTAKAMLGDEAKCLEAGASAYLSKPIDSNRLFGTLASYFEGEAA